MWPPKNNDRIMDLMAQLEACRKDLARFTELRDSLYSDAVLLKNEWDGRRRRMLDAVDPCVQEWTLATVELKAKIAELQK